MSVFAQSFAPNYTLFRATLFTEPFFSGIVVPTVEL
jgi:hypothetical protein